MYRLRYSSYLLVMHAFYFENNCSDTDRLATFAR